VFLDANILFSAAYRETTALRQLWTLPAVQLMTSDYAIQEVRRNLDRAKHPLFAALLQEIIVVPTPAPGSRLLPPALVLPVKDAPIFLAAAATSATHLVTGERRQFGSYFG